jgi:GNAT superfamily N-acetyltransferase
MKLSSLSAAYKHGLIMHKALKRLGRLGLKMQPYCVILEGKAARKAYPPDSVAGCSTSVATQDDLNAVVACGTWADYERLRARLLNRHLCILLKRGDRVVGYTWADPAEINHAPSRHPLQPGEAYLYDAFVAPEMRGLGLAPYMRAQCYDVLNKVGFHTFYSVSEYFNTPAIRFKMKLGARISQTYLTIRLGQRQLGPWLLKDYGPITGVAS